MNAAVVTTVGGIVATVVTLAIFLIGRNDKRKDPITRTAAELAIASDALGIVQASRDALSDDVTRLIAARTADRERIAAVELEVRAIREGWAGWYRDLTERWAHHREQPRPPHAPDLS